ncbi:MAG TPA: hypothetical protein VKR32_17350 [Puia sp.]|nr:hypothetical protein [Puia sp.]
MSNSKWIFFVFEICRMCIGNPAFAQPPRHDEGLRVVFIRHAEKPLKGENLNCQGLNRSEQIPTMLIGKFGVPDYVYVPKISTDSTTRHSRMFQTIIPLAVKYNLIINSKYAEKDSSGVAADIKNKSGTVLVVWEHRAITPLVRALGIPDFKVNWGDDDYESIWIISFTNGIAKITYDKEGLVPGSVCPF